MNADQTVTAFCKALTASKIDEAMNLIAEDCVYHNIPIDPVKGRAAIQQTLEGFMQMLGSIELEILKQVSVGDVVMNERVDSFVPPGKAKCSLPVAGVFEVKNGKITAWRDYFDVRQFTNATGIPL